MRSERKPPRRQPVPETDGPIRLQAFLARAGVASRRASEELILDGQVTVNGRSAEIGSKVNPHLDTVRVAGRTVTLRITEWVMLHKPRGYVTTRDDPTGRKTVYDLLPRELHHLFHVGRLDRDSSGLLLLTNDGDAANRLLHPRYETTKVYRVDVEGRPSRETLQALVDGVPLEDGLAQVLSVEFKGEIDAGIYRLVIVLQEGRNREVRRLLEGVGHPVKRLFRREFGPLEIGRLGLGEWRRLTRSEVEALPGQSAPKPSEEKATSRKAADRTGRTRKEGNGRKARPRKGSGGSAESGRTGPRRRGPPLDSRKSGGRSGRGGGGGAKG